MNPFKEYIEVLECAHMGNEFEKFGEAFNNHERVIILGNGCLLYTSPSPRDVEESRMPSSA